MTCPICDEYPVDCSCARRALRRLVEAYQVSMGPLGVRRAVETSAGSGIGEAWAYALRVLDNDRSGEDLTHRAGLESELAQIERGMAGATPVTAAFLRMRQDKVRAELERLDNETMSESYYLAKLEERDERWADYDKGETITVCDACLRACCWQGVFMCEDSLHAGTTEKTRGELEDLDLEHSDYWEGRNDE